MSETNLTALQLADSFLPVGTYTFSYGLETLVEEGRVEDADDLGEAVHDLLTGRFGPTEMVAVANAYDAAEEDNLEGVEAVDRRLTAATLAREPREASAKSGTRLLSLFENADDAPIVSRYARRDPPSNHSVAVAVVASADGVTRDEAGGVVGYSFVTDLLGAGMRLLSVGHHEAQSVLNDAKPTVDRAWRENRDKSVDDMSSRSYVGDIACMRHEDAESRLFFS
jgi:urease accessory protein